MNPLFVTQPNLAPLSEFVSSLEKIWQNKILTNAGPFHVELEAALCSYLGVEHLSLFSNGTIGLVTALQALGIEGEVITTPYSFVATAHSLLWNNLKPVFVDINPFTLNLDPDKIEAAITDKTTAILPVHVYGHACDVEAIDRIARKYSLKVIYDGAHAFGVDCHCGSLLNHGDLTVLSFHATKVFNTFEGGAIVSPDAATKKKIDQLKNFGFVDEVTVVAPGINGKMNEVSSAFGLLQLKYLNEALEKRRRLDNRYRLKLSNIRGLQCRKPSEEIKYNYAYFPVFLDSDFPISRDELYQRLRDENIFARRYFYPLISDFPMYTDIPSANANNLPVAKRIAQSVICLPLYPELSEVDQDRVIDAILKQANIR